MLTWRSGVAIYDLLLLIYAYNLWLMEIIVKGDKVGFSASLDYIVRYILFY